MKEPDTEGVATHGGPEPCTGIRENAGEAWDRGTSGPGIEPRNQESRALTLLTEAESQHVPSRYREAWTRVR